MTPKIETKRKKKNALKSRGSLDTPGHPSVRPYLMFFINLQERNTGGTITVLPFFIFNLAKLCHRVCGKTLVSFTFEIILLGMSFEKMIKYGEWFLGPKDGWF